MDLFGNSSFSSEKGNKIDASLFVQKPFRRIIYNENNKKEIFYIKKQFRIKYKPHLLGNIETVCKSYVKSGVNDPSVTRNNAHTNFSD